MASLTKKARNQILAEWMRDGDFPPSMTKPDLLAAIRNTDQRQDNSFADYDIALQARFRNRATKQQKQRLYDRVASKRTEAGV